MFNSKNEIIFSTYTIVYLNFRNVAKCQHQIFFPGNCDFELNTCGWTVHEDAVFLERYLLVCGILGYIDDCGTDILFQSADPWKRKKMRSINLIGT